MNVRALFSVLCIGLLAGSAVGALLGVTARRPVVSKDPITRLSSQAEVLRHFHLGTLKPGVYAYTKASGGPGAQEYIYEGGKAPKRWIVMLLFEQQGYRPYVPPPPLGG